MTPLNEIGGPSDCPASPFRCGVGGTERVVSAEAGRRAVISGLGLGRLNRKPKATYENKKFHAVGINSRILGHMVIRVSSRFHTGVFSR